MPTSIIINLLSKISSLLSNGSLTSLVDPDSDTNKWLENNPMYLGNVGRSLISDFYINYKTKLNLNINNLDQATKDESQDIFKEIIEKNEFNFLNSFTNVMITSYEQLEYLTSAIETSKVLLNSIETSQPLNTIESIFDSSNHLFERLKVCQLMPIWGSSFSIAEKGVQHELITTPWKQQFKQHYEAENTLESGHSW